MKPICLIPVLILWMLFALLFNSCEKTDYSGKAVIYTNAQALVNCGQWNVQIYIDGKKAGTLELPYTSDASPSCDDSGGSNVLVLAMRPGAYTCTAKFDCSSFPDWNSSFEIKADSCSRIYIDFRTVNMTDTITVDNVNIPTINRGYYGRVLRWQGDFMPGTDNPGTVTPVNNEIYLYQKLTIDLMMNARVDEQSSNFYYPDSIFCDPLFIIIPNDSGYYEIDPGIGQYSALIKIENNQLYINNISSPEGQLGPLNLDSDTLIRRNLNIDFEMSI